MSDRYLLSQVPISESHVAIIICFSEPGRALDYPFTNLKTDSHHQVAASQFSNLGRLDIPNTLNHRINLS